MTLHVPPDGRLVRSAVLGCEFMYGFAGERTCQRLLGESVPLKKQFRSHLIRFAFHPKLSSQTQRFVCVQIDSAVFWQNKVTNFVQDAKAEALLG